VFLPDVRGGGRYAPRAYLKRRARARPRRATASARDPRVEIPAATASGSRASST
jgi:hypothetical protein